jgi:hypothetical protein
MYEAVRANKIQTTLHAARRTILVFGILTLISLATFIIHFKWMRRLSA